jgi:lipopolysaccharide assembly protein A
MRFVQAVILLTFLMAVGLFAVQNTATITVRFLNWGVTAPLALLTVAIYLVGMLTGWTVVAFMGRSIRRVSEHPQA